MRERNVAHCRVEFDNFTKQMRSTRVLCVYSTGLRVLNKIVDNYTRAPI